jgi:hypothetical protein
MAAIESMLEALLPGVRYAKVAREGGKPSYGTSTVFSPQPKPGNAGASILNRLFNPLYSFERAGGGSTGSSGGAKGTINLPGGGKGGTFTLPGGAGQNTYNLKGAGSGNTYNLPSR